MQSKEFTSYGNALLVSDGDSILVCDLRNRSLRRVKAENAESISASLQTEKKDPVQVKYTNDLCRAWHGFSRMMLLVTRRCNLGCVYCYASAGITGAHMPIELALNATNQYFKGNPNHPKIAFHGGGEPTLNMEVVAAVYERAQDLSSGQCRFSLITNGTCSERTLDWLVQRKFGLTVSWDGPSEIQDRNRPFASGKPSSHHLERTAAFLVKQGYRFVVRSTVSPRDDVRTLVGYFANQRVPVLKLEPLFPHGRKYGQETTAETDVPPPNADNLFRIMITALDACQERGIKFSCTVIGSDGLPAWHGPTFCGIACGKTMVVTHDGNLSACSEVVDSTDTAAPTFLFGKFSTIQKQLTIKKNKLGKLLERNVGGISDCQACAARYVCGTGCAVKAFRTSGSLMGVDPNNCEFQRKIIPALIKRAARLRNI